MWVERRLTWAPASRQDTTCLNNLAHRSRVYQQVAPPKLQSRSHPSLCDTPSHQATRSVICWQRALKAEMARDLSNGLVLWKKTVLFRACLRLRHQLQPGESTMASNPGVDRLQTRPLCRMTCSYLHWRSDPLLPKNRITTTKSDGKEFKHCSFNLNRHDRV